MRTPFSTKTIRGLSPRGKIRLRARLSRVRQAIMARLDPSWSEHEKLSAELDFWINQWDAKLRQGEFWNSDIQALLEPLGEWPQGGGIGQFSYDTMRWLEARAHGFRILREVGIDDPDFFVDKRVADIGPGAVCFLEASGARLGIAIEPLALEFIEHRLLLQRDHVVYLPVAAENLPMAEGSIDIVVSRNNLDHVFDPGLVISEALRILRPGGLFLLIVHLEPQASVTEPHAFDFDDIRRLTRSFVTVDETIHRGGRTEAAATLAGVYRKPKAV